RSVELSDDLMDTGIHRAPLREEFRLVGADRLAHVEMHVAVAEMAERYRTAARNERLDRRARRLDEFRHRRDRNRDVVLDRPSLGALRLADEVAQVPERLCLLDAGRDRRIGEEPALGG